MRNGLRLTALLLIYTTAVLLFSACGYSVSGGAGAESTGGPVEDDYVPIDFFDDDAHDGSLTAKSREDVQSELNEQVKQGMFTIAIASLINMRDGESSANVRIQNPATNGYYMQVTLKLSDTGEELYKTKAIKPGQVIEAATFNRVLPKGRYNATAVFTAITTDTLRTAGVVSAEVIINVEN